ncbi:MAG: FeoB-associated Cys-rich membrane protein [Oscillospiraceae bacterium]|nr:FeoB-associated Cys-rich membrane protein [Oscillospiraceae bacterium]
MNTADIILTAVIAAAVVFAVTQCIRRKKKGGCCGCEGCSRCSCPQKDNPEK